jgi:hypothetical protein
VLLDFMLECLKFPGADAGPAHRHQKVPPMMNMVFA